MALPTSATALSVGHTQAHQVHDIKAYYGAVADGVTDDTAAVAAAYTAARADGIPVLWQPGTYIVSAQTDVTGTTTFGYGATAKHKPSVTNFIAFAATGAFSVYGLAVDMNKSNVTDPADGNVGHHNAFYLISTGWSGTARLKDLTISNAWGAGIRLGSAITTTDADSNPVGRAEVSGCYITNCDYGIFLPQTTDVHVHDNTLTSLVLAGIWDYLGSRLTVSNNTIAVAGDHGIVTQNSRGVTIIGNSVSGAAGDGIVVGGGSVSVSPADKFSITGNVCRGNTLSGIAVDTSISGLPTTLQNVHSTITGNVCTGNGIHGIYGENAGYLSVAGNTCQGNVAKGIQIHGYRCAIAGNICTGNDTGIGIVGTAGTKGEHRIAGNAVAGNTTAAYSFDAYARIGTTVDIPTAALATSGPDGHLRIPTCAGPPSGTPTAITGTIPLVYDTTNQNLYIYNGGWKKTTVFS